MTSNLQHHITAPRSSDRSVLDRVAIHVALLLSLCAFVVNLLTLYESLKDGLTIFRYIWCAVLLIQLFVMQILLETCELEIHELVSCLDGGTVETCADFLLVVIILVLTFPFCVLELAVRIVTLRVYVRDEYDRRSVMKGIFLDVPAAVAFYIWSDLEEQHSRIYKIALLVLSLGVVAFSFVSYVRSRNRANPRLQPLIPSVRNHSPEA